jgi:hypothetical protein
LSSSAGKQALIGIQNKQRFAFLTTNFFGLQGTVQTQQFAPCAHTAASSCANFLAAR